MQCPRVRFTVRRLMILVAIVALPLGIGVTLASRRARFLEIAREHLGAANVGPFFKYYGQFLPGGGPLASGKIEIVTHDDWHMEMARRYFYASDHPWLPVPPDPPEPE